MGLVLRKHLLAKQNFPLQKSRELPVVLSLTVCFMALTDIFPQT